MRYPALIDGTRGAYGVVVPDLPGCVAMGATIDDALRNAEVAMRDWVDRMVDLGQPIPEPQSLEDVEVPPGSALTSLLLVQPSRPARSVRLNLVLEEGVAATITAEAERRGMTRKRYVEWMTRTIAGMGG